MAGALQSIRIASKRSGLSTHVIRVWEKRYGAVTPQRTGTNRRLYSGDEIERLTLLRLVTAAGHTISNVAQLSTPELRSLAETEASAPLEQLTPLKTAGLPKPAQEYVDAAIAATQALDGDGLERLLNRAVVEVGQTALLHHILVPLIEEIGRLWHEGELRAAHEHVATAVIRTFLGGYTRAHSVNESSPGLLVTTPAGQLHELGAILAAATATIHGWKVTYLGPSLPAEEIAGAALQNKARAVALSLVYPEDDPNLSAELRRLRRLLPAEVALLVGGRAAHSFAPVIEELGATLLVDLPGLGAALDRLRKPRRGKESGKA